MMKTIIAAALISLAFSGCSDEPFPTQVCHEGVVIGKIRSVGGGIAVSMSDASFGSHEWRGHKNVVEALNIPRDLTPGAEIYLFARFATEKERSGIITADGDESKKPVIYVLKYGLEGCPEM